jgi:hypothetical protein
MEKDSEKIKYLIGDLSKISEPQPFWVALSADQSRVVAFGKTLHEARKRAVKHFGPDAIFMKIIAFDQEGGGY